MAASPFLGMGPRPVLDWERMGKLNVELVGYGWGGRRLIARFHLPKDTDLSCTQRRASALARDVKHSKHWQCEFCGESARETNFQNLSWHHLNPPRLIIYVHFVCDMGAPHVREGLTAMHGMLQQLGGAGPVPSLPKRPAGVSYPLAGSCAFCERDETAASEDEEVQLDRCSGCRMTRYCGTECQRKDWPRHKITCAMVHSVKYENWD